MAREMLLRALWRELSAEQKRELLHTLGRSKRTLHNWFQNPELIPYLAVHQIKHTYNKYLLEEDERPWTAEELFEMVGGVSGRGQSGSFPDPVDVPTGEPDGGSDLS